MVAAATPVPGRRLPDWAQTALGQALALGLALALAALVGGVIIGLYHESPLDVYATIWRFSTERPSDIGRVLENATPLIYSALAVAVAFKAGMFNIGVEGQYLVGMVTAAAAAVTFDFLPAFVLLPLVVLAAMAGSMIWAAIPAVLKSSRGGDHDHAQRGRDQPSRVGDPSSAEDDGHRSGRPAHGHLPRRRHVPDDRAHLRP